MLNIYPANCGGADHLEGAGWIDLVNPTPEEVALVKARLGIDVPTEQSLQEIEATSRLRVHQNFLYLSAPLISGTTTSLWQIAPVGFIFGRTVLVTVRFVELQAFRSVSDMVNALPQVIPADVLTSLLEEIVDRAADHLERAAESINATSQEIFFDEPKRRRLGHDTATLRSAMRKTGQVSDHVARVRYTFLSLGRMADFIMERCDPALSAAYRERLHALRRDIASLDEFELTLSSRVQLLQDSATGFISIEQNDVVKVLTVASVVGVPPVLVVGVYGMNFKNMPELSWQFGYPFAILLCVFSMIVPLLWFKWRDWL